MFEDYKKRIPQVIFENPDELISGEGHQKLLLDGVDLVEVELNKKADSKDVKTELDKKVDNASFDSYKKEQESVNDSKVDKESYDEDLDAVNDRINAYDAGVSENKQELNGIKKLLGEAVDSSKVVGTAKGGGVVTFPSNVLTNASPRYRIEGLTLQNLVKNGDFKSGTIGWYSSNAILGQNSLTATAKGGYIFQDISDARMNDYVYKFAKIKSTSSEVGVGIYADIQARHSGSGAFEIVAARKTVFGSNPYHRSMSIVDNRDSGWDKIEVEFAGYINLTQTFGKGNEPSKEWCDEHIGGYFDGVKSVQAPMRIKSQRGNDNILTNSGYFDISEALYWPFGSYNKLVSRSNNIAKFENLGVSNTRIERIISLYPGTYTVSVKTLDVVLRFRNFLNADVLSSSYSNGIAYAVFSVKGTSYQSVRIRGYYGLPEGAFFNIEYFKLERGDKMTPWMPSIKDPVIDDYRSMAYVNNRIKLKLVGNTHDYIENGKLYQNIKRHYFSKSDEWTLREDYEGANFRYYMTLPFEYKATGAGVENELLCNNFTPTSNVASVLTERESNTIALYRENASTIYLTLGKKVSDVNSIIPEGTFIDVILPQTEVTNLDTSGMVVARPNGTVFIEPIANLTAFYNNGLDVSTLTIEEVESFSTFKDGNYQELDVSKVAIKDGKLTHPNAVNGLCYLVYRHDDAPIYGNNEVDYYNSEKTLKSPNGKVWKKIEEATDEGELVTKLEEVK